MRADRLMGQDREELLRPSPSSRNRQLQGDLGSEIKTERRRNYIGEETDTACPVRTTLLRGIWSRERATTPGALSPLSVAAAPNAQRHMRNARTHDAPLSLLPRGPLSVSLVHMRGVGGVAA